MLMAFPLTLPGMMGMNLGVNVSSRLEKRVGEEMRVPKRPGERIGLVHSEVLWISMPMPMGMGMGMTRRGA